MIKDIVRLVRLLLIVVLVLLVNMVWAQRGVFASGGEGTGAGGSISYTIGQPFYQYVVGSGGFTISEGVHHPLYVRATVDDVEVCRGVNSAALLLSADYGTPVTYTIDYDGPANGAGFIDVTQSAAVEGALFLIPQEAPEGIYAGVLTYMDGVGAVGTDAFTITLTAPTVDAGGPYAQVCPTGGEVILHGLPVGGTWSGEGVSDSTGGLGVFDPTGLDGGQDVVYSYTDTDGCSDSESVTIHVSEAVCSSCPDNDLVVSGMIASGDYVAGLTLESAGTVAAGSDVLFQAGQTITLEAGFTVAAGATFQAVIDDCATPSSREEITEEVIVPQMATPMPVPGSGMRARVYPNPLRYNGQIVLELAQTEEVSIQVYDQSGRLVREVIRRQMLGAGNYSFALTSRGLYSGMFYVAIQTASERQVLKVITIGEAGYSRSRNE